MAVDSSGRSERPRLAWSAGRFLLACEQKFALDLKETRFDRAGTTKSPQEACQSMTERKLEHGSRINTADEGTLERAVGSNILEIPNDGLMSEPVTLGAAAFAPDRYRRGHLPRRFREVATSSCSSMQPRWALLAWKIRQGSFFLRRCGGADVFVLGARVRGWDNDIRA